MTKPLAHDIYEYAGFRYTIYRDVNGKAVDMIPVAGQHVASRKEKHRRAALQMYLDDKGKFDEVRATIANAAAYKPATVESLPVPTRWRERSPETPHHVNCPSCDGPITVGAKTCPTCGAQT